MSLDLSAVGILAADLMEIIDDEISSGELSPESTIGEVAVVVEVREPNATCIRYLATDERRWVQRGLFAEALRVAIPLAEEESESE